MELLCAIITIGGAGLAAAESATKLYRAVEDAKMFEHNIQRIAREFRTFGQVIRYIKLTITTVMQKSPKLRLAQWINKEGLAEDLEYLSEDLTKAIETFTDRFRRAAKQGPLSFGKKLVWAFFHGDDGDKLVPRLHLLSHYFFVVLFGLQTEALLASPSKDSDEIKEELYVYSKLLLTPSSQHVPQGIIG